MTASSTTPTEAPGPAGLRPGSMAPPADHYARVRVQTERLCSPLQTEDYVVQSMPDVSPTKWHLAHTTWFFETLLLLPHCPGYRPYDPQFAYLFNSYYLTLGDRHCRQNRGLLSRPTVREVYAYRRYVDDRLTAWMTGWNAAQHAALGPTLELGLHHEQQHQELLLTDLKHVFWVNPLRPAYHEPPPGLAAEVPPLRWVSQPGGLRWIGHDAAESRFAYDNESPRHQVFIQPFALASRLITNGEYLAFIDDGGYRRGTLWLSDGWATVQQEQWTAPLYWLWQNDRWWVHTLAGLRPLEPSEPLCHVSYYEADAFARWAGARLPTEQEWEVAAAGAPVEGNFVESQRFHPAPLAQETAGLAQLYGDLWEWTRSPYTPYPGYRPPAGAIGEYNAKFMCNQLVLRGGSCATPQSHIRLTYRNFFPAATRWQFMGIRLARDV